jgi:diguanylate cyclase (GGDEF)-like protein
LFIPTDKINMGDNMILPPEILTALQTSPLFLGIPKHLLAKHLSGSRLQTLAAGQVLLVPSQPNNSIYIILSGRLRIQSHEYEAEPIVILGAGECVGEMSMLGDAPVSMYVVADTDCRLLAIAHGTMWELINNSHAASYNMLNMLTSRLRNTNEILAGNLERELGFAGGSMVDELTGLYNQKWTQQKFDRHLRRGISSNKPSCLLLLEMDHLKQFTESYGQLGGDQALRDVAYTTMSCLRPDDQAGRYSDDKFAIFLPNTSMLDACTAAERLTKDIGQSLVVLPSGDALPSITVSIGVSEARSDDTLALLFDRAEQALQLARDNGGNCVKAVQ